MHSFKLLPKGAGVLKQYCKNRPSLFEVIEKDEENYIVRASNKNWINHLFKLGILMEASKDEETKRFYLLPDSNIMYELEIEEVIEFWKFIDQIRDPKKEVMDLRLFKD